MMLVMIRGSVRVETLPVNGLTPQVAEKQHENATQRLGIEDSQGRHGIIRTLTICLRLPSKTEGRGSCCRGHKRNDG